MIVRRAAPFAAVLAFGFAAAFDPLGHADPGLPGTPATIYRTVTEHRDRRIEGWNVATWRRHAVANRRALNASHAREQRLARRIRAVSRAARLRYAPTVGYAIALARAVYGVDQTRRTYCESTDDPGASNGSHFGLLQFAASTWASTPFGRFNIYDPVAQELAGGWMTTHGRSGEWTCRL